jgi:hypothetical protein
VWLSARWCTRRQRITVILPEAPPYLALDVVRGEWLYVGDADVEAVYQLYVLRRAGDLAPFERARLQMILAGEAI